MFSCHVEKHSAKGSHADESLHKSNWGQGLSEGHYGWNKAAKPVLHLHSADVCGIWMMSSPFFIKHIDVATGDRDSFLKWALKYNKQGSSHNAISYDFKMEDLPR